MIPPPPAPPPSDVALGLGFYLSSTPGVAGRIKDAPESFRVSEISSYPMPDALGSFTVLRVESRGWEQHELASAIARRLGLGARSVRWSGTKDRRAVADRLLSYRGPPPSGDLGLADATIVEAYRARDGLVLGHHYGNAFEVRVTELARPAAEAILAYRATESALRHEGGFPNFFGPQRFGEVRPVTHEVGRALVRGDLAEAIECYLVARPAGSETGPGDSARLEYDRHHDPARALREFPPTYRFERSVLERLAEGAPPDRAFRALPYELRRLFVHAFQAYLFNLWMTRRHELRLSLTEPEPGDRIVRVGRDGTARSQDSVPVAEENRAECADLVARGRAFVAGPLVGSETAAEGGRVGALLTELLEEERVEVDGFDVPAAPELASRGAWRPALVPVPPIGLAAAGESVWFRFSIPKGAYATVLLREFLKRGTPP